MVLLDFFNAPMRTEFIGNESVSYIPHTLHYKTKIKKTGMSLETTNRMDFGMECENMVVCSKNALSFCLLYHIWKC